MECVKHDHDKFIGFYLCHLGTNANPHCHFKQQYLVFFYVDYRHIHFLYFVISTYFYLVYRSIFLHSFHNFDYKI